MDGDIASLMHKLTETHVYVYKYFCFTIGYL